MIQVAALTAFAALVCVVGAVDAWIDRRSPWSSLTAGAGLTALAVLLCWRDFTIADRLTP